MSLCSCDRYDRRRRTQHASRRGGHLGEGGQRHPAVSTLLLVPTVGQRDARGAGDPCEGPRRAHRSAAEVRGAEGCGAFPVCRAAAFGEAAAELRSETRRVRQTLAQGRRGGAQPLSAGLTSARPTHDLHTTFPHQMHVSKADCRRIMSHGGLT